MPKVSLKRILLALGLVLATAISIVWIIGSRRQRAAEQMMQDPAQISRIVLSAVQMWQAQNPGCPTVEQLRDAKLLDPAFVLDRWGSAYSIECTPETLKVHSLGPDHQPATMDDVLVTKRR